MAALASCLCSCVLAVIFIGVGNATGDLCIGQWKLNVEGVEESKLTIHHSSTYVPELFTHLVWQWRDMDKVSGTIWVSQHRHRGKFDGGFVVQPKSLFRLPASVVWTLVNGTLAVTTHGQQNELASYPAWHITVCDQQFTWGITADNEIHLSHGSVNETRSLDESWSAGDVEELPSRRRRQAEFPAEPDAETLPFPPPTNPTTPRNWWRRFLDSIGFSNDGGRARSWIWELTETLFKFIFASAQQRSPSNIPINPNSEVLPLTSNS
ncbi:uncharacterized protein LOC128987455 [Macrosteles quadrilineatus]|uniref:uncharacterized protein LOC128987455 n=1 Tax=Macrosteles quadrilineatus TaxID=74068 RepID=UPI0023E285B0|nr:uncharacterized protein LOC128987455 [Macrosteles quadrilineatus]